MFRIHTHGNNVDILKYLLRAVPDFESSFAAFIHLSRTLFDMSIKIRRSVCCTLFFLAACMGLQAQDTLFAARPYPQGYLGYPVEAPIGLAANYGELRPNHWHMGLDCRTMQRQNIPILSAADGYIAKIKIEPYGFGRAIYINHPNGYTTLYAHLNDFYPELEKWVRQQQYARKQWRVFLDSIPADLFPVKKGQFVAYSGNTGGSQGPHLHFEVRDTRTDKVLNPLLFGFNIPDNVPPKVFRLAVYDRCRSVFEQTPKMYPLQYQNGAFTVPGGALNLLAERVSFAISATDAVSGNPNPNGIYQAVLYDNDEPVSGFQLDNIGYDDTRYLNAHIDYRLKTGGGPFVQHLTALPGYIGGVYKNFRGDGIIDVATAASRTIKIEVKDAAGNTTLVRFTLNNKGDDIVACAPDSLQTQRGQLFFPNVINVFDNKDVMFYTGEKALYDSTYFRYARFGSVDGRAYSSIHQLHSPLVPVHTYFAVNIRPEKPVPASLKNRMVIKRTYNGGKFDIFKATPNGDWFTASFRGFGNYVLMADETPPSITPVGIANNANLSKAKGFAFVVKDDSDENKNFRALLDGTQWLLFSNDKGRTFKYTFDEFCPPGEHVLKVYVEDEAGNSTEKEYRFTR
jgi:hypothetical protein